MIECESELIKELNCDELCALEAKKELKERITEARKEKGCGCCKC